MKTEFSATWNKSTQPRKQRKFRLNAPKHIKSKFISSHLADDLKEKYQRRSVRVRVGDKVKVLRGQFNGKTVKVERIDVKKEKLYINGVEMQKKDGSKVFYGINPSNVMITELTLEDKRRSESLKRKSQ